MQAGEAITGRKAAPRQQAESTGQAQVLSNAQIADRLAGLGQLLSMQKGNPYKVRAYQRAAARIRALSESLDQMVREEADLTQFAGIGQGIASAIREIVLTGTLTKLDTLRGQAAPEIATLADYPRLDPKRVLRVYKKLRISSIEELRRKLDSGEIEAALGARMAQHVRQGLSEAHSMLLYRADDLRSSLEEFLLAKCGAKAVEVVGAYRRRVEVIEEIAFVIQTDDFPAVVKKLQRYGGRTELLAASGESAVFALAAGITLRLRLCSARDWGLCLIAETGSEAHLKNLKAVTGPLAHRQEEFKTETALYRKYGLSYIEPELREGHDEVTRAQSGTMPSLVKVQDIRGELHAHSTSSDGSHSIEQMAMAARDFGYAYIGITDHSQSLKIARGLSVADFKEQIRFIDGLNSRLTGIRVLKSAEVDILADGTLDYPNELLKELDYTVGSIHSRFGLGKQQQTERILRAMDNRYFNILGHATGRLLLKRPGYEVDMERIIERAQQNGCFFEINSSPDRLDLSAENARLAREAGVRVAVTTDAHSTREFGLVRYGIGQARRAGMEPECVLNCLPWIKLEALLRR